MVRHVIFLYLAEQLKSICFCHQLMLCSFVYVGRHKLGFFETTFSIPLFYKHLVKNLLDYYLNKFLNDIKTLKTVS